MPDETIAPEDPVVPDQPDEVELLDTGRVRLRFGGRTITLREVKVGELKTLKRAYFVAIDSIDAIGSADRSDQEITTWLGWFRKAIEVLGDGKLPAGKAAEELPAPWATGNFAAMLLLHWQSRPLPRGLTPARG